MTHHATLQSYRWSYWVITLILGHMLLIKPLYAQDSSGWQNQLPQGHLLSGIWGNTPENLFVVGDQGTLLHYDGAAWQTMASHTTTQLTTVWGSTTGQVFVTSQAGQLLRYTGSIWELAYQAPTALTALWGSSDNDIFVAGIDGAIFHYQDQQWTEVFRVPTALFTHIWGSAANDVFVAGWQGAIFHYNGQQWTPMVTGTSTWLKGIWGSSATDVFAVGKNTILHYDGQQWTPMTPPVPMHLNRVWGTAADNVFAVGENGVLHYDGQQWQIILAQPGIELMDIWGDANGVVFVVGEQGTILQYADQQWTTIAAENRHYFLEAVWGSDPTDVFAVGDQLLHYNGSQWTPMFSALPIQLKGVWGTSHNRVFAVGDLGTILHYDGWQWLSVPSGTLADLTDVWGLSPYHVFAVGQQGTILNYNGTRWYEMLSPTSASLQAVWGSSLQNVWAVGETMLHYDGQQWSEVDSSITPLYDIWGSSAQDIWAVGGAIFHYDGQQWQEVVADGGYVGLTGHAANDVFAVSRTGVVLHYDGQHWITVLHEPDSIFADVWGNATEAVFAVGDAIFSESYQAPTYIYTLTIAVEGNGTISGSGIECGANCVQSYPAGTLILLIPNPQAGAEFVGWQGAGCASTLTLTQDLQCTARFQAVEPIPSEPVAEYSIAVTVGGSGQGSVRSVENDITCEAACTYTYPLGTVVTLTAVPQPGSTFIGWRGGEQCADTFTLTKNMRCSALFALSPTDTDYTLVVNRIGTGQGSVQSTPEGIDCGTQCASSYSSNTAITLTATPASDSTFVGWYGDACADTITLTADTQCAAIFTLLPASQAVPAPAPTLPTAYPLTLTTVGQGVIEINPGAIACETTCYQAYPAGTSVTLTAIPTAEHTFLNWTGDCQGTALTTTVTLTAAQDCTAVFGDSGGPAITISPAQYHFGPVPVGTRHQQTFTVLNTGTDVLQLGQITLAATTAFALQETCSQIALAPDQQCQFAVELQPQAEARYTAKLTVPSNALATPSVAVTLQGTGYQVAFEMPSCPATGTIDFACDNRGRVLTAATLGPQASILGGELAYHTVNQGLVSSVTIQPEASLSGGQLTGYITNYGLLADFEFVGAAIVGGTLAGEITNASQITGYFQDVYLAAQTHITGGFLRGQITGDIYAPALLEQLTVMAGSHLVGVILGEGVVLSKAVTLGAGVQRLNNASSSQLSDPSTDISYLAGIASDLVELDELSDLDTVTVNGQGKQVDTITQFKGGISVNFGPFKTQVTLHTSDFTDIRGEIQVEPAHVGLLADLVVYAAYQSDADQTVFYMLDGAGNILPWDRNLTHLTAFAENITLMPKQAIQMYHDQFALPGAIKIFFGYRLQGEVIILSVEALRATVIE